jgi:hypothetical protein
MFYEEDILPSKHMPEPLSNDGMLELNKKIFTKCTKFQNRLIGCFGKMALSKALEKFYDLSFECFLSEMNKVTKLNMTLKEQDEWEDYFNSYKRDVLELKSEREYENKGLVIPDL